MPTFPKNIYGFTSLTGGGQGALDRNEIDGAILNDQDFAIGVVDGKVHQYWLDEDSGATESSPDVIAPDANPGDKRWILVSIRISDIITKGPWIDVRAFDAAGSDYQTYVSSWNDSTHLVVNNASTFLANHGIRIRGAGTLSFIDHATITGAGLDDATSGGTFSGTAIRQFRVEIDGAGTPDTFKWSKDNGVSWDATLVAITGAAQALTEGVTITFAATTGHTATDRWDFNASVDLVTSISSIAGTTLTIANAASRVTNTGATAIVYHDDSAAIQAAIDSLTSGGIIFFPVGIYLINSTVALNEEGTRFIGATPKASHIHDASKSTVFRLGGATTLLTLTTGCSLENIYFDGNGFTGRLVDLTPASSDITMKDVTFLDGIPAIYASNTVHVTFENVLFRNCGNGTITAALEIFNGNNAGTNCSDWWFVNCCWEPLAGDQFNFDSSGTGTGNALFYFFAPKCEGGGGFVFIKGTVAAVHIFGGYLRNDSGKVINCIGSHFKLLGVWFISLVTSIDLTGGIHNIVGCSFMHTNAGTDIIIVGDSNRVIGCNQISGNVIISLTGSNNVQQLSSAIMGELANMGATTISAAQWEALGAYIEGTWTPAIAFGGASVGVTYHAVTAGLYTKIGNKVFLSGRILLTSKGESTGSAVITGLPFTNKDIYGADTAATLLLRRISYADTYCGMLGRNTATISLLEFTAAGVETSLTDADFANDSDIFINVTYIVE